MTSNVLFESDLAIVASITVKALQLTESVSRTCVGREVIST